MATLEEILAPYINNQGNIGKLNQAYALLNQPAQETGELAQRRGNLSASGTENLARAFAQEYQSKYGKMPSESEISQFVSASFTPEYAKGLALSGTSDIGSATAAVSPYLQQKGQDAQYEDIQRGLGSFDQNAYMKNLGDIFGAKQAQASGAINDIFNKQKIGQVNEAAALGNLRSNAGYAPIGDLESQRSRALSDSLSQILGEQGGAMNQGLQFGANFGLNRGQAQAGILGQQQTQGLNQNKFDYARNAQDRQDALDEIFRNSSLAEEVRKRQGKDRTLMDDIEQGVGIANSFADFGKKTVGAGKSGGIFR